MTARRKSTRVAPGRRPQRSAGTPVSAAKRRAATAKRRARARAIARGHRQHAVLHAHSGPPATLAEVQARVSALQAEAAKVGVLTLEEKRRYLRRVVLTPVGQVTEKSELCQKYESHTSEGGTRLKDWMPDKLRAIELDSKLAGEQRGLEAVKADNGMAELMASIGRGEKFSPPEPPDAQTLA